MSDELERFLPGLQGEVAYEHWHRYYFAATLVAGCSVLDAASGEGYGSALLARHARHVTGVDIDSATVAAASQRYRMIHANLDYRVADCRALPFAANQFDAIVSMETIEHLVEQPQVIGEFRRVLAHDGILLLSCPNAPVYSRADAMPNPHHAKELDEQELVALLQDAFPAQRWFAQNLDFHSTIAPLRRHPSSGEVILANTHAPTQVGSSVRGAKYFVVAASLSEETLARVEDRLSVFVDETRYLMEDHTRMIAAMRRWHQERGELLRRLQSAESSINRLLLERNDALFEVARRSTDISPPR